MEWISENYGTFLRVVKDITDKKVIDFSKFVFFPDDKNHKEIQIVIEKITAWRDKGHKVFRVINCHGFLMYRIWI